MSKVTVAVIILHFGNPDLTIGCLDSLKKINTKLCNLKVLVLNNTLPEPRLEKHPIGNLLLNPGKNLGFAGGNNTAFSTALKWNPEYVLFLNNDTVVEPDFLDTLVETARESDLDIAGPVIEHKVGELTRFDYGGYIEWKKGQPKHVNKDRYERKPSVIPRDFVSGCSMLIKSDLFKALKGFNESYFLYLEDVDLCLRARKSGAKTALVTGSKIFHKGSQSSTELVRILYSLRNSLKLTLAHVPVKYAPLALGFNCVFYPALYLRWQARRLKRRLFPKY